jgi:hypothetical protein
VYSRRIRWLLQVSGYVYRQEECHQVSKALRSIIAYALPLAIGVGTEHVVEGVLIAAGAALLGAVGLTYTHRARTRTLQLACVGIALSAFIGTITGNNNLLAILLIGIWGSARVCL